MFVSLSSILLFLYPASDIRDPGSGIIIPDPVYFRSSSLSNCTTAGITYLFKSFLFILKIDTGLDFVIKKGTVRRVPGTRLHSNLDIFPYAFCMKIVTGRYRTPLTWVLCLDLHNVKFITVLI
jgi:hypothetical protein